MVCYSSGKKRNGHQSYNPSPYGGLPRYSFSRREKKVGGKDHYINKKHDDWNWLYSFVLVFQDKWVTAPLRLRPTSSSFPRFVRESFIYHRVFSLYKSISIVIWVNVHLQDEWGLATKLAIASISSQVPSLGLKECLSRVGWYHKTLFGDDENYITKLFLVMMKTPSQNSFRWWWKLQPLPFANALV